MGIEGGGARYLRCLGCVETKAARYLRTPGVLGAPGGGRRDSGERPTEATGRGGWIGNQRRNMGG